MTLEEFLAIVSEDPWFKEHHLAKVTREIGEVWLKLYEPTMADFIAEGTHEFCVRFAFFMMGWQAHVEEERRCYASRP